MTRIPPSRILVLMLMTLVVGPISVSASDLYKLIQMPSSFLGAGGGLNDYGQLTCVTQSGVYGYWQDGQEYSCGSVTPGPDDIGMATNNALSGNFQLIDRRVIPNAPQYTNAASPYMLSRSGSVTDLIAITPPSAQYTSGKGLNDSGKAVGCSSDSNQIDEPFYYDGTFHMMGFPTAETYSYARGEGINNNNKWICNGQIASLPANTGRRGYLVTGANYTNKVQITSPYQSQVLKLLQVNDRDSILCKTDFTAGTYGYYRADVVSGSVSYLALQGCPLYTTSTVYYDAFHMPQCINNDNSMAGTISHSSLASAECAIWNAAGSASLLRNEVISMGCFSKLVHVYSMNNNGDMHGYGGLVNGASGSIQFIAYLVYRFPNMITSIVGMAAGNIRDNLLQSGDNKVMTIASTVINNTNAASSEFQFYGVPASQTPSFDVSLQIKSTGNTYTEYWIYDNSASAWVKQYTATLTANTWKAISFSVTNQTYLDGTTTKYKYIDSNGKIRIKCNTSLASASYTLSLDQVQIYLH